VTNETQVVLENNNEHLKQLVAEVFPPLLSSPGEKTSPVASLAASPRTIPHPHDLEEHGRGGLPPLAEPEREMPGARHDLGDQPRRVLLRARAAVDPQEQPAPQSPSRLDPGNLCGSQCGMRLVHLHAWHVHVLHHLLVRGCGPLRRHPVEARDGREIDRADVGGAGVADTPALALQQPFHRLF
jgi:hypothetical protein